MINSQMGPISEKKCVMIIAGEASGDHHGAKLVNAMQKKKQCALFLRHRRTGS